MATAISLPASTFRKVLKGFEIGGLPYTDVQFHLKRLLAAGTSPEELQEVLRRCELITPLPDYAHAEVMRLLEEARDHAPALPVEPVPELEANAEGEADSAGELAAELRITRNALAAEHSKTREISRALAERIGSEQAARARSEDVRRESEHFQGELRNARHLLSSRDAVIAQMRVSLDECNAQIGELRKEHAAASTTLESRGKNVAQLQTDLESSRTRTATLSADLAAARAALETEQRRRQEIEKASVEKLALNEAALQRRSHAERDAQLASLRLGHEKAAAVLETRAKTLEGELQAARRRLDAMTAELKSTQEAASALNAHNDRLAAQLRAGQSELGATRTERDSLRAQAAALQSKLKDNESLIDKMPQPVRSNAQRAAEFQAAVKQRESGRMEIHAAAESPARIENPKLGDLAPVAVAAVAAAHYAPVLEIGDVEGPKPAQARKRAALSPMIGVGAAIVMIAFVAWLLGRHPAEIAKMPAVIAAAAPKAGTVLHDCPTCPAFTVLPAGRFQQGTKAADDASPFEKPLHIVAIAYPFAISTDAVTVDEFRAFVAATGHKMQGGCDTYDGSWRHRDDSSWENPGFPQTGSHPVTCTSWNDAKAYAAWLSTTTGHHYRLPSASEWEYAARAGGAAVQPWTDAAGACAGANVADISAGRRFPGWAVFGCDDSFVFTAPVGSFKANAFGLNDMLGNVFQWTEDCWRADYADAPIDGSARTGGDCSDHELRGGSWFSNPAYVRANYRNHFAADYRTSSVGIRLVRDVTS
ncbi:MAG TPA: SUMF1/EgtB/PvdO family nonheme iron enzyme [Steroidobacteraceae bacterium]|jgi:formylglycine-generating enzyme required for sulfatase activity|nr:SUMF1/EgtB/PvdO family nonheme iron enzyme [Steroidobacteraceae bacterium]